MKNPVIDGTVVNPIVFDVVTCCDKPTCRLVIDGVSDTQKLGAT